MDEGKVIEVLAHIERSTAADAVVLGGLGHYQSDWVQVTGCGTTACFAGWTTILDGWAPVMYVGDALDRDVTMTADNCQRQGDVRDISVLAEELLDLGTGEAYTLFYNCSNLSDLYDEIARMMGVDRQVLVDKVQGRCASLSPLVFTPAAP